MVSIVARPNKTVGRVVLGPRPVRGGYARIVSLPDGSGRLELFSPSAGAWHDAAGECTFDELWRAAAAFDSRYLSAMTRANLAEKS